MACVDEAWFDAPPAEDIATPLLARMACRPGYFLFVGTLQPRKNLRPPAGSLSGAAAGAALGAPAGDRRRPGWRSDELVRAGQGGASSAAKTWSGWIN
jgi:hypothetical protein